MSGMSTMTDKEIRKLNTEKLYQYHKPTFDALGITNPFLLGKLFYKPKGHSETIIALFPSEMEKGVDIYVERCDKLNSPEDPNRTLYKYKYNPYYKEEYQRTDETEDARYIVPVSELKLIVKPVAESESVSTASKSLEVPDPETDLPIGQMTIRDLAAILLEKPVSRKEWLNQLITKRK